MKHTLKKQLNLIDIFCVATGAMISSGLFILPGLAFNKAGPSVILSYIIAGILCIPTLLSNAELVTAMPKAGGDYYFIIRSLGPLVGTISGFLGWLALSLKSAFAIFGKDDTIILKKVNVPSAKEAFDRIHKWGVKFAKSRGLKESSVESIIHKGRGIKSA